MNKNILLLLVLVLVIGLGYWWINSSQQVSNTSTDTEQESVGETNAPADEKTSTEAPTEDLIVTYGANGFSPASITIKKGQKISFKNESGKSMWVASDDHPSHDIYPEFDAKTGTANGSMYEFTFDKVGTWGYHDHLSASKTGIVIVE